MTTLVVPVVGVAESTSGDHAQCGALNDTAVAQVHWPGTVIMIPDNATEDDMASGLLGVGVPPEHIVADNINGADFAVEWVNRQHYGMIQVYCDGNANPVPPAQATAAHWITVWRVDADGTCWYYQCWTAVQARISLSELRAASFADGSVHWNLAVLLPENQISQPTEDIAVEKFTWNSLQAVAYVDALGVLTYRYYTGPGGWGTQQLSTGCVPLSQVTVTFVDTQGRTWRDGGAMLNAGVTPYQIDVSAYRTQQDPPGGGQPSGANVEHAWQAAGGSTWSTEHL